MANPRKEITAAVASYLKEPVDGEFRTGAGARVFDNDDTPPDADNLPEINVVFARETIDPSSQHQPGIEGINNPVLRIMGMRVEVYHTAGKAEVDDVAWQVEEAIRANPTLSDMVSSIKLSDIDLFVAETGTVALYAAIMSFEVVYWTHLVQSETGPQYTILLGFAPEIGLGNESHYTPILGDMV